LPPRFGPGTYATHLSYPTIHLDTKLIDGNSLDRAEVESAAARILAENPAIAAVYTRTQLENGALPGGRVATLVQRAWHRQLSGDLYVVQRPYAMFGSNVATHGSPYAYDTNVPLMLFGPRWIRPGPAATYAEVVDLAPTLAYLLETRMPSASEGRVLAEILRTGTPAAATPRATSPPPDVPPRPKHRAKPALRTRVPRRSNAGPRGKSTYVLVHGAWHGGWCWKKVVPALRASDTRSTRPL